MSALKKAISIFGNILFHVVFGIALTGGAVGFVAIVRFWHKKEPDEGPLLIVLGALSSLLAVLALLGIAKFRDKRMRTFDAEADIAPLRDLKPWSNLVSGLLILTATTLCIYWEVLRSSPGDDIIEIPVVILASGAVQALFGLCQLLQGARRRTFVKGNA